ncbi:MAG TPA: hypothetical protein VIJ12_09395 [Candidatus Baltobacteraceae bacterium]
MGKKIIPTAARALGVVAALALFASLTGLQAQAQVYPSTRYAQPGYARNDRRHTDVTGIVTSFDRFDMTVRTRGRDIAVHLHQGTIINPTGTDLRRGMIVNVSGYRNGGELEANRIDFTGWAGRR